MMEVSKRLNKKIALDFLLILQTQSVYMQPDLLRQQLIMQSAAELQMNIARGVELSMRCSEVVFL